MPRAIQRDFEADGLARYRIEGCPFRVTTLRGTGPAAWFVSGSNGQTMYVTTQDDADALARQWLTDYATKVQGA